MPLRKKELFFFNVKKKVHVATNPRVWAKGLSGRANEKDLFFILQLSLLKNKVFSTLKIFVFPTFFTTLMGSLKKKIGMYRIFLRKICYDSKDKCLNWIATRLHRLEDRFNGISVGRSCNVNS